MVVGVDDEDVTFLERVWTLYCDYYDNDGTVGIDDGRWGPHRDGAIEWQRGHRSAIDCSRAEQVFDSITTRYPGEPNGLTFTVFRDDLAGRDDLNRSYVSGVTRGMTRMAGRYRVMRETGEEPLLEIALSRPGSRHMMLSWKWRVRVTDGCNEFS